MKTIPNLFSTCPSLWTVIAVIGLCMPTASAAATNAPTSGVERTESSTFKNVQVYSIRFSGGNVSDFFKFLRTNGFANDTVLFAGRANEVQIPRFSVANVQLREVAKSIEFVAESKITVELVEAPQGGDVNIWRIKLAEPAASAQMKTKACAVPHLLAGAKANERVHRIVEEVYRAVIEGSYEISRNDAQRPRGNIRILESEKIVVAVGSEAYVEAVASALEAAEGVAATVAAEKKKTAE